MTTFIDSEIVNDPDSTAKHGRTGRVSATVLTAKRFISNLDLNYKKRGIMANGFARHAIHDFLTHRLRCLSSKFHRVVSQCSPGILGAAVFLLLADGPFAANGFGGGAGNQDVTTTTGTASGSFPYAVENVGNGNSVLFKLGATANTISVGDTYPGGLTLNKSVNFTNSDTGGVLVDFGGARTNAVALEIASGTVNLGTNIALQAGFGGTATNSSLIYSAGSLNTGDLNGSLLVTGSGTTSNTSAVYAQGDMGIRNLGGATTASGATTTYGLRSDGNIAIDHCSGSVSATSATGDAYGIYSNGNVAITEVSGSILTAANNRTFGHTAMGIAALGENSRLSIGTISQNSSICASAKVGPTYSWYDKDYGKETSGIYCSRDITIGDIAGTVTGSVTAGNANGIVSHNGNVSIHTIDETGSVTAQAGWWQGIGIGASSGAVSIENLNGSIQAESGSRAYGILGDSTVRIDNLSGTVSAASGGNHWSEGACGIKGLHGITLGTLSGVVNATGGSCGAVGLFTWGGDINGGAANIPALITGTVSATGTGYAPSTGVYTSAICVDGFNSNLKVADGALLSAVSTNPNESVSAIDIIGMGNSKVELVAGCTIIGNVLLHGAGQADLLILSGSTGSTTLASRIQADQIDVTGGHWTITGTLLEPATLTIGSNADLQSSANLTVSTLAGAGSITLQDTTLTVDGTASSKFSGVLANTGGTGSGTLLKTGSGYLNFAGTCTNVNVDVARGTLAFNGTSDGSVTVETTSILGGTGTIASLTNRGTLAPGNSIGTLHVAGDFTNVKGTTLALQINGAGASDKIAVGGTALLEGGTVNVMPASGDYRSSTTYTFLTASSVSGRFDSVTDNWLFLDTSLVYNPTNVQLLLTAVDYTTAAQTFNQYGVANYLDTQRSSASGDFATVLGQLNALSNAAEARAAFDAMGGEVFGSLSTIGIEDHERFLRTISQRLQSQTIKQIADDYASGEDGQKDLVYVSRNTSASSNWTTWAEGYGVGASIAGNGNASGLGYSSGGVAVGMERQVSDSVKLGMAGGYSSSYAALDARRDNASIDGGSLALYVHRKIEFLYLTGIATYGYNSYSTERQISFATIDREAHANYGGNNFSFYTEAGRTLCGKRGHLQPYVGLEYIQLHQDDFVENGANSIDISTGGVQADAFRSMIGSRLLANLPTKSGRPLTVEGRAAWRHEFLNENRIMDASFAGQTGTNFAVAGINVDRDAAIVGTA